MGGRCVGGEAEAEAEGEGELGGHFRRFLALDSSRAPPLPAWEAHSIGLGLASSVPTSQDRARPQEGPSDLSKERRSRNRGVPACSGLGLTG